MPIWRISLGLCGLVLLTTAFAAFLFPDLFPAVQLAKVERVNGTAEIKSRHQALTAGPAIFHTISVDIRYPKRIRQNETLIVEAQANLFESIEYLVGPILTDPPLERRRLETLAWPVRLALSGAAFNIDPRERSFPKDAALPLNVAWTALAKSTGTHTLVLDWSEIAPPARDYLPESAVAKVLVNDRVVSSVSNLSLPVEVVTKWGIKQFWADLVKGLVGLIGFLATLQFLGKIWKWIVGGRTAGS